MHGEKNFKGIEGELLQDEGDQPSRFAAVVREGPRPALWKNRD